jgi:hypothetical protein
MLAYGLDPSSRIHLPTRHPSTRFCCPGFACAISIIALQYYAGSDSCRRRTRRQVSPLPLRCRPSIPSPTTCHAGRVLRHDCPDVALTVTSAHRDRPDGPGPDPGPDQVSGSRPGSSVRDVLRQAHRITPPPAFAGAGCTGSLSYRLLVRLRLLPTPHHGDAVTFGDTGCDLL